MCETFVRKIHIDVHIFVLTITNNLNLAKMKTTEKQKLNFIEAESVALNLAYKQFFGEKNPVGIAYTFIADRKNGNEWSAEEKQVAKLISERAIRDLSRQNLTNIIEAGIVPDCAMARRFMATGSGQTAAGYNY